MATLELSKREEEVLLDVLEITLRNLSYEIADTDRKEYRDMLKARREVLTGIVEDLKES